MQIDHNHSLNIEKVTFEQVEIKGRGHPDTLCDLIAEHASRKYSRYCLNHFGRVANHWFDKVMLIGGESEIEFGHSKLLKPYEIIFAGKVSNKVGDATIPVYDIIYEATFDILKNNLILFESEEYFLLTNKLVDYQGTGRGRSRYRPESVLDMQSLDEWRSFESNDCNLLSAYYPLSPVEQLTMELEDYLNGNIFKSKYPSTGTDIKIFSTRNGTDIDIIANIPFIGKLVKSKEEYSQLKSSIAIDISNKLKKDFYDFKINFHLNPHDKNKNYYLVAHGSAADTGDVGVVGRGNRINGLITPMRAMSIEAPCGKNPLDHTGKIYGVFSRVLAKELHQEFKQHFEVHIFTKKGDLLFAPHQILIKASSPHLLDNKKVDEIVNTNLNNLDEIILNMINGDLKLC